jgi:hypothetical protein
MSPSGGRQSGRLSGWCASGRQFSRRCADESAPKRSRHVWQEGGIQSIRQSTPGDHAEQLGGEEGLVCIRSVRDEGLLHDDVGAQPHRAPGSNRRKQAERQEKTEDQLATHKEPGPRIGSANHDSTQDVSSPTARLLLLPRFVVGWAFLNNGQNDFTWAFNGGNFLNSANAAVQRGPLWLLEVAYNAFLKHDESHRCSRGTICVMCRGPRAPSRTVNIAGHRGCVRILGELRGRGQPFANCRITAPRRPFVS